MQRTFPGRKRAVCIRSTGGFVSKRDFAFFALVCVAGVIAMALVVGCHFHLVTIQVPKGSAAATLLSLPLTADPVRVEVVNSNGEPADQDMRPRTQEEMMNDLMHYRDYQP